MTPFAQSGTYTHTYNTHVACKKEEMSLIMGLGLTHSLACDVFARYSTPVTQSGAFDGRWHGVVIGTIPERTDQYVYRTP